jgi:hypothetical protein
MSLKLEKLGRLNLLRLKLLRQTQGR